MAEVIVCKNPKCKQRVELNNGNHRSKWQQCPFCQVAYFKIYWRRRRIKKVSWRILNNHNGKVVA